MAEHNSAIRLENEVLLEVQRSNKNNFFWLEKSPSKGTILRGLISISNQNNKTNSNLLNHFALGDIDC